MLCQAEVSFRKGGNSSLPCERYSPLDTEVSSGIDSPCLRRIWALLKSAEGTQCQIKIKKSRTSVWQRVCYVKAKKAFSPPGSQFSSFLPPKFPAECSKGHGMSLAEEGSGEEGRGGRVSVGGSGERCVEPSVVT